MVNIMPDWSKKMTVREMREQLQGFEWKGSGIYHNGNDSMMIIPEDMDGEFLFSVYVYNERDVSNIITLLSNLINRT